MSKIAIIKLITYYSILYGVDPKVSVAVCAAESQFNPNAIRAQVDYGLFQLNSRFYTQFTAKQLLNPRLNIKLGVKYLAKVKKECKYKDDLNYLLCYNIGIKGAKSVKHPELWPYTKRVKRIIEKNKNV